MSLVGIALKIRFVVRFREGELLFELGDNSFFIVVSITRVSRGWKCCIFCIPMILQNFVKFNVFEMNS